MFMQDMDILTVLLEMKFRNLAINIDISLVVKHAKWDAPLCTANIMVLHYI